MIRYLGQLANALPLLHPIAMFEDSPLPQLASVLRPQTAALFLMLLLVIGIYMFYLPQ